MKHLTETAADLIQNFKKFMSENLTTAKKAAEDKLSKTNNPEERAKIKKEIADINAAQKKIENIENTKDMSPKQVLAALKEDKVLAKALDTLLKVGTKDEKTGKVSLSENQIRDLNTKLFGVVFKDDEKLRSSIADILYRNPKTAEEFFGFKTAKDFLQTVQENIKAEKKKDEETKAKEKREEEAQTKRDSAKQAEARIAENKRQEKIKETIRSNDSRAVAAYKTGNFSVTTLLAHGYTLTEILNEVSMGGLSGVGTEARRQVIALLKSKGKELKGDETLSKLIDLITAS